MLNELLLSNQLLIIFLIFFISIYLSILISLDVKRDILDYTFKCVIYLFKVSFKNLKWSLRNNLYATLLISLKTFDSI